MNIREPKIEEINQCADIYISAYQSEPWNEIYEKDEVIQYLLNYMNANGRFCYCLEDHQCIVGIALGLIVPSITKPYMRIEDFCVCKEHQHQGYGSSMMNLIQKEAEKFGCDCILLNTQKDYPSHHFYRKLGFQEIETVLLLKEVEENID